MIGLLGITCKGPTYNSDMPLRQNNFFENYLYFNKDIPMSILGEDISLSYKQVFTDMFMPMLQKDGSRLMNYIKNLDFPDQTFTVRQRLVGDAMSISNSGAVTDLTRIVYDTRKVIPELFGCALSLSDFDAAKQGISDVQSIIQEASMRCGEHIDKIILRALSGTSETGSGGKIDLPATQIIKYNDTTFRQRDTTTLDSEAAMENLSYAKVAYAAAKLRTAKNTGPLVCVAGPMALQSLKTNERVANLQTNILPALATLHPGQMTQYAGISHFIECHSVERATNSDGVAIEYAYVFDMTKVTLGSNLALDLQIERNPEEDKSQTIVWKGAYGATRLFEESVALIEVKEIV